ncbi:hypothetical protein WB401_39835 [Streptomyces brasiliscabiei]|uniref:HTH araC/xylS-type domain-containing protein n=1 Tax=Streptomyces brasiliscabiei TaxID=2736302 RepID=A0ABU8GGC8_9ACTN
MEKAAQALTAPGSRLTVSEAAALWYFTDSGHFIRAFKTQYHATPVHRRQEVGAVAGVVVDESAPLPFRVVETVRAFCGAVGGSRRRHGTVPPL